MDTSAASPDIRTATDGDLAALIELSPDEGDYFADRLARQGRGLGQLIIAWLDGHAVGQLYVWLEWADEPRIREYLPRVPLLQHAWVAEPARRQGIGTSLFAAAERLLYDHGHRRVALAVEWTNSRAHRLYLELGYRDWRHGPVECSRRMPGAADDPDPDEWCFILVKSLSADQRPANRKTRYAVNSRCIVPSSPW